MLIANHVSLSARADAALACALGLRLTVPILVDTIDDLAQRIYGAWPERLYVLDEHGRVAFQCGKGPYGFDVDELEGFLEVFVPGAG